MFPLRENRCHRFQANIFNKSKCQNCFKPLDSHILIDTESYPRKTVQAGWLLLAPEDTDFRHKNRKWQRRYFVLYKHGFLFYSLDAMPGTLPHGSVNMTQCCEILDASAQTGFQNCLKLCFTDRDYYIRTDNADGLSISSRNAFVNFCFRLRNFGATTAMSEKQTWRSNLQVYPKASKLNQKLKDSGTGQQTAQQKTENQTSKSGIKKSLSSGSISGSISNSSINRRGSLTSGHYPDGKGPVSSSDQLRNTVTSASGILEASTVSDGRSCSAVGVVKKDTVGTVEGVPGFSPTDLEESTHNGGTGGPSRSGSDQSLTSTLASSLSSSFEQLQEMSITHGTRNRLGNESGYSSLEKTSSPSGDSQNIRNQSGSLPASLTLEAKLSSAVTPSSIASREPFCRDEIRDPSKPSKLSSLRSKSLERRQTDPAPTPDLLNFKKGWMSKLGDNGKWQKHWFVLTDKTLRFYRDAVAEEAADVDGEINLSTCFDVTDYPVQRNYGFQIHTKEGVFTLCAMTYGIRRNWVQAVMKNIRPTVAPDVTWKRSIKSSSIPQRIPTSGQQARPCSSQYSTLPKNEDPRSRLRDRRKEGRYKTFDWADLKRQKEELSNDMLGRDWNKKCERSVPPAPASSPEGMTKNSISQPTYKDFAQQLRSVDVLVVSRRTSQESISPDSLEVDTGTIQVHIERPSDEDKMIDQSTSPVLVSLSSSSTQTEWQWQEELQSLCEELKAQQERNQSQENEFKLTESRLQADLNNTQDCLQRAESRIQDAETLLKKREEELESLRGHFQEATGRLKTMEEAQALKEVRLQNHLRLLQESQERERRSLTDSLDQSEHRLKELEVCLMEKTAELQKRPVDDSADDLIRRCQELQNQLEESDGEVTRLQARLQTEETLYYDMEHDYERACEEIQSLRGNLLNSDRVCEERFQSQLVQQQQEMDKKERELQEILVKMSILGSSLEEAELKLKEKEDLYNSLIESKHVIKATNIQQLDSERQEDAFRMISVIQALEHKLCDTEDRLRDLTVHLKQQQKLNPGLCALNGDFDFCFHENGVSGDQCLNGETPGCHALHLARRVLSLEALVVQKMASALEHPSGKLLKRISEMHEEVLMMTRERSCTRLVRSNLAQSLLNPLEQDPIDLLSECTIHNMCVRADMAFLVHTQPSPELPSHLLSTRTEHGSKQGTNFADMNPPELVPYSEQTEDTSNLFLHDCENLFRNSLVAELRAQARSLQDFSSQLRFDSRGEEFSSKLPSAFLRLVMGRATLAYMICRVRATMRQEMTSLCKQREQAECECRAMCRSMESLFQEQTERFEEKLREERVTVEKVEMRRASAENEARLKSEEVEKLRVEFEDKLRELQKIHEDEMGHLHEYYMQNTPKLSVQKPTELESEESKRSVAELQDRNRKLELEITCLKEELSSQNVEAFHLDLENIKATYEHGFSIIEDSNQRVIEDLQRQHQREVERLTEEKERLLQEETNATIAAIEAMRKAHKEEMDKTQKAQENGVVVDISEQLNEELETLNRELEVLSEQYSQKCLENMQLARTVESEKEALSSTQRENQELRSHNQELNECLATELSMMYSRMNGELQHSQSSQEKDVFQLEVNLRVKESEIKCLKQEINTVKLELQATNSHFKDLESELSSLGVKFDLSRKRKVPVRQQSLNYDLFKYRSNPDFQKDNAARPQPVRSKSLKDELSVLERMTVFELPGSQKH